MGITWQEPEERPAANDDHNYIRVFRLKPGDDRQHVLLLGKLIGTWMHWTGKSVPCLGSTVDGQQVCESGGCPHYPGQRVKRWYGPGAQWTRDYSTNKLHWKLWVLEFNDANEAVIRDREPYGLFLEVFRGNARTSPLLCRIAEKQPSQLDLARLPRPFDVRPILLQLWGVDAERKAEQNPDVIKFNNRGVG